MFRIKILNYDLLTIPKGIETPAYILGKHILGVSLLLSGCIPSCGALILK
jgi:hypothetical protein